MAFLLLHLHTKTPTTFRSRAPAHEVVLPVDFDMSPDAIVPYLTPDAELRLHQIGELGPERSWFLNVNGGWTPVWSSDSDAACIPRWRYCPPRCKCPAHRPAVHAVDAACSVDGRRWPTRAEFLEAHRHRGALDEGIVRFEAEVDAGLRHDDEVVHDAIGLRGCPYCEAKRADVALAGGVGAQVGSLRTTEGATSRHPRSAASW